MYVSTDTSHYLSQQQISSVHSTRRTLLKTGWNFHCIKKLKTQDVSLRSVFSSCPLTQTTRQMQSGRRLSAKSCVTPCAASGHTP